MSDENKKVDPYTKARDAIAAAVTEGSVMEAFEVYDASEGKLRRRAKYLSDELEELLDALSKNKPFHQQPIESLAAEKVFELRLAENKYGFHKNHGV